MRNFLAAIMVVVFLVAAIIACGGSGQSGFGADMTVQPENMRIAGLPQYVCPTSTPRPTHTQVPTVVQPTVYSTAAGYVTYTPVPGATQVCDYVWTGSFWLWQCNLATNTPYPGGANSTPGYVAPGATSTPRPTHTPWPSPTPYTSTYYYFFDDDVYTEFADTVLDLRLRIGNIRVSSSSEPNMQTVIYEVQIENRGSTFFVIIPAAQIYVSGVGGETGFWSASKEAADDAGITLAAEATDGVQIQQGETVIFDLVAYTPVGNVDAVAWILDPYAGFDGINQAGGNIAYWLDGTHQDCLGNVDGNTIPTPSTPHPTATMTATADVCQGMACATILP